MKILNPKVISVDARNHGESEHSPDMSYESMAEDVLSLIGKLNLTKKTVLLGHSMGGKIAMTLALMHVGDFVYLICFFFNFIFLSYQ